jgi:hypothetical protein
MPAIVDTGPLVAVFDQAERHHRLVAERIEELEAPLLVCEPVLTEAMYLLGRYSRAQDALFELLQYGALDVAFRIEEHIGALGKLLQKIFGYTDVPCGCLHRTHGGNPSATRGPDARLRFFGLSEARAGPAFAHYIRRVTDRA